MDSFVKNVVLTVFLQCIFFSSIAHSEWQVESHFTTGVTDYEMEVDYSGIRDTTGTSFVPTPDLGFGGDRSNKVITVGDVMPYVGISSSIYNLDRKLSIDISYQRTLNGNQSSDSGAQVPRYSVGSIDMRQSEWGFSISKKFKENFTGFGGYVSGNTRFQQALAQGNFDENRVLTGFSLFEASQKFEEEGVYGGVSYTIPPVILGGELSITGSIAYLGMDYKSNPFAQTTNGEFLTQVSNKEVYHGNAIGGRFGVTWSKYLTDQTSIYFGCDYYRYEFDFDRRPTTIADRPFAPSKITEDAVSISAGISVVFPKRRLSLDELEKEDIRE